MRWDIRGKDLHPQNPGTFREHSIVVQSAAKWSIHQLPGLLWLYTSTGQKTTLCKESLFTLIMSEKNWKDNSACNSNVHTCASQHKEKVWRKEDKMESVSGLTWCNVWGCNANTAVWLEMQRWINENLAVWLRASCRPSVRILWGNGDLSLLAVQCVMTKSMFWCQSHAFKWRVSFQNHTSVFISDVNSQLLVLLTVYNPVHGHSTAIWSETLQSFTSPFY